MNKVRRIEVEQEGVEVKSDGGCCGCVLLIAVAWIVIIGVGILWKLTRWVFT